MRATLFVIEIVLAMSFVLGFLWLFDIVDFRKGQQLRLSERFVEDGSVFKKFNSVSVFPNESNQSVFIKIETPLKEQFKPDLSDFRVHAKAGSDTLNENTKLPWHKLVAKSSSFQKLDDCYVLNQKNWMCDGTVDIFTRQLKKLGRIDGDWVYIFGQTEYEFHDTKVYSSKIKWLADRRKCGSLCFIGTVEQMRERANALQDELRKYIKRE